MAVSARDCHRSDGNNTHTVAFSYCAAVLAGNWHLCRLALPWLCSLFRVLWVFPIAPLGVYWVSKEHMVCSRVGNNFYHSFVLYTQRVVPKHVVWAPVCYRDRQTALFNVHRLVFSLRPGSSAKCLGQSCIWVVTTTLHTGDQGTNSWSACHAWFHIPLGGGLSYKAPQASGK